MAVDFWKVVWEQRSRIIAMLTREEEMNRSLSLPQTKCHCYWPSTPYQTTAYGPLKVTLLTETRLTVSSSEDVIIIRQLTISHTSSPAGTSARIITHLQYTGWCLITPSDALRERVCGGPAREGIDAATAAKDTEVSPMIVHCSAGCGRSGAFCTIDTVMRKMAGLDRLDGGEGTKTDDEEQEEARRATEAEGVVDLLYETVERFREQRVSMVQTLRQYVFCYEAVMW
ncbi:protein-tyrosine phosphatase-like protein [Endogone sp. FLAS-F59071]|nr:protein-tyrosine phosphatase-like protein [Endogone sp. FLAS-F59071]|eukprot:RUS14538.1 protein-tyrosine phosphatase-like protein [Endogone sp. FLAS-F59071]